MPKNPPIPSDADPAFQAVMKAIRTGKNPEHARIAKMSADKQKAVRAALKRRAGKHTYSFRNGDGDNVVDSGMFDS